VLERGVRDRESALDARWTLRMEIPPSVPAISWPGYRGGSERVDVVVDQTLEGVEALRAGRPEEGDAGGRGQRGSVAGEAHVGDVIGDEAVAMGQRLAWSALCVKQHQAVGGGGSQWCGAPGPVPAG
jgi:hypothetical protein